MADETQEYGKAKTEAGAERAEEPHPAIEADDDDREPTMEIAIEELSAGAPPPPPPPPPAPAPAPAQAPAQAPGPGIPAPAPASKPPAQAPAPAPKPPSPAPAPASAAAPPRTSSAPPPPTAAAKSVPPPPPGKRPPPQSGRTQRPPSGAGPIAAPVVPAAARAVTAEPGAGRTKSAEPPRTPEPGAVRAPKPAPRARTPEPGAVRAPKPDPLEAPRSAIDDAKALLDACKKELIERPGDDRSARLHHEIATLYETVLDEPARAADHYQKATKAAPDHLPSIRGARRTLVAQKRYRDAVRLFDAEVKLTPDGAGRARLLSDKGLLLETHLGQRDEARRTYLAALKHAPNDVGLLKAVERCEIAADSWAELAATWAKLQAATTDPAYRAALASQRAWLAEARRNDPAQAAELYEAALALDPDAPGALTSLKRLAHAQKRWRELTDALRRECERSKDPSARGMAMHRVAQIHEHQLGDAPGAIAALELAVQEAPEDDTVLAALCRLYEESERHDALATALAQRLAITADPERKATIAHQLAELHAGPLEDAERAERWYLEALDIDGDHRPARDGLAAMYEQRGDWEALLAVITDEAEGAGDEPSRAEAHARAGDVLEARLGRPDDAAAAYDRALVLAPRHPGAFKALARLHAAAGRFRELAELYRRVVDADPAGPRAIAYLFRIGALREDRLDDPAGAVHAYQQILAIDGSHLGALQALQSAAERAGAHEALIGALEREAALTSEADRKAALLVRAAELCDLRLGDADRAVARLERVLADEPGRPDALTVLGRLYERAGRWEDLLKTWEAELERIPPGRRWVRRVHRMAEISEARLGDGDRAARYLRRALDSDPTHEPSFQALDRLLEESGDHTARAALLEQRLGAQESPAATAHLAMEIGRLYEDHLGKPGKAITMYDRAIAAAPGFRPAVDARARLLAAQGSWLKLAERLDEEAEAASDVADAVDARLLAGRIRAARLRDAVAARETLDAILEAAPDHLGALLGLEELLLASGDRDALADIYRRQAARLAEPSARAAALRQAARLSPSMEAARAVLAIEPEDLTALEALARQATDAGDLATVVEACGRLSAVVDDRGLAAHYQGRVATILEDTDPEAALAAYRAALAFEPKDLLATRGFTRVALALGDPDALREAGRREAEVTRDTPLAVALLERSALTRMGDDPGRAAEDLILALDLDPDHGSIPIHLVTLLVQLGRVPELIDRLGRAADRADKVHAAGLHVTIAHLHADHGGSVSAAIAAARRALNVVPGHLPAVSLLATLLEKNEQWKDAADALGVLLAQLDGDEARVEAHLRLAAITDEHLKAPHRARESLRAVLEVQPDRREALGRRARLEVGAGPEEEALELTRRLVEASTGDERADALVHVAHIETARGQPAKAAEALTEAVGLSGPDDEAAAVYRDLIERSPQHAGWPIYMAALVRYVQRADRAGDDVGPTLLAIAGVQGDRLGDAKSAIATLRKGLDRAQDPRPLRLELARRLAAAGRHDEAQKELRAVIAVDVTAAEAWRGLGRSVRALGDEAEGLVAAAPLLVLKQATPEETVTLLARRSRPAQAPPGLLGDAGFREIAVDGASDASAAELVFTLADAFGKLYAPDPERFGLNKRDRIQPRSGHPLRVASDRVAIVLGVPEHDLYQHAHAGGELMVDPGSPPAIYLPSWAGDLSRPAIVFLLGRVFGLIARQAHPILRLTPRELAVDLAAAARAVSPGFGAGLASDAELEARGREIGKAVPRRGRRAAEHAAARYAASPTDVEQWVVDMRLTAERAALLLCDDLAAAAEVLARCGDAKPGGGGVTDHLMRFWVSDSARRFRQALG